MCKWCLSNFFFLLQMCPSAVSDSTMFHFIVTHNHILDIHFVYYSYLLISGLWIYFFSIAVFNHFSVLLFRFVILQVLLFWIIYEVVTDCKCKAWISSFAKKKKNTKFSSKLCLNSKSVWYTYQVALISGGAFTISKPFFICIILEQV